MIPFSIPFVTGREIDYLAEVIAKARFAGNYDFTRRCQDWIKQRLGGDPLVLLTHSCTAALEISALLLDLRQGDEVVMPSYTFCSTASAFARTGAKIVFCDVDPGTMMTTAALVEAKITPATKAIVPIHYGGLACEIEAIADLAERRGVTLVEDAAQAFDACVNGKPLGTFGRFGCISFHETKNLHAGLCGALYVNDPNPDLRERAVRVWERGTNRQAQLKGLIDKYTWTDLGSSFYPSELQAAFLLAQLEAADENKAYRRKLYERYAAPLTALSRQGKLTFPEHPQQLESNFHACYVVFNRAAECDRVRLKLKDAGAIAYIGYVPLHSSPMGIKLGNKPSDVPVTEEVAPRVLRLPFHNGMLLEDVDLVTEIVCAELAG